MRIIVWVILGWILAVVFELGLGFELLKLARNQCNRTSMEGGSGKAICRKKQRQMGSN